MTSARGAPAALAVFFVLGGCARAGPAAVLDDYVAHLRHGRVRAAYALTTPAYRRDHDLAAFSLAAARAPLVDRRERPAPIAEVLVELAADGEPPIALVAAPPGTAPRPVRDPARVADPTAPEDVLAAFARAIATDRRARAVALLTPALRERFGQSPADTVARSLAAAARRIEQGLLAPRPHAIVTDGVAARWLLGEGSSISLQRGIDGWQISALD